jgi:tryptophan halogenase
VLQGGAYAYHLDAAALADYLREIATGEGVKHLFGDVRDVVTDGAQRIASLDIDAERSIEGDLFIDATGFAGLLIEKALGDPWIDWSSSMLCDSAVAMPLPRGDRFAPFTISKAMPAGWTWRIPLSTRTGNGYVFSSAHCSTDEAIDALIQQSGLRRAGSADPRVLKIRVGRRTNFWVGNCVAVGLSSGFVEPLESTGIHLIQKAVTTLADYLPDRNFSPSLRRAFNASMADAYDEVRDFIVLHYLLSRRNEPFWRDSRSVEISDTLRGVLELYDETGRIAWSKTQVFPETSYFFILAGAGRIPRRLIQEAATARAAEVWQILDRARAENRRFVERMPTHASYLERLHQTSL